MIETQELCKKYGSITAVDRISFKAEPGQVLGFLGPNGAGKSTTMKMLTGFLAPTSGAARVCGLDVSAQATQAQQQIGYLPEGAPCYGEMSVLAFLEFVADIRALVGAQRRQRLDDVIGRLSLTGVLTQTIDTLSKGFRRRVGLAQALVHDPQVLILDEPTDGLDPNQKHEVRTLINAMAPNKTIVVSTHILEEVHAVCNRAIIIAQGRILADDTPEGLLSRSRYHQAVSLVSPQLAQVREALSQLPGVECVEIDVQAQRLTAFPRPGQAIFPAIGDWLRSSGIAVSELQLERGRLDEVFRTITQAGVPAEAAS